MYEAKVDNFSNKLKKRFMQGDMVPIDEEEYERNKELYNKVEAQEEAAMIPRAQLEAKALKGNLCKKEEIAQLSYDQLLRLVKKG